MANKVSGKTWLFLGGLLASGFALASVRTARTSQTSSPAPNAPSGNTCYSRPAQPLQKPTLDLVARVKERIVEVNPGLKSVALGDFEAAQHMANVIATTAYTFRVPLPIAVALARQESHFNLHVDSIRKSLEGGRCSLVPGSEIGPYQVKPGAWCDVGMDASKLLTANAYFRVEQSVIAGLKYLALCRDKYVKSGDWCEIILCFTLGPTGYKDPVQRAKREEYLANVINWANGYSELARPD